jgi:hypothetical protein
MINSFFTLTIYLAQNAGILNCFFGLSEYLKQNMATGNHGN